MDDLPATIRLGVATFGGLRITLQMDARSALQLARIIEDRHAVRVIEIRQDPPMWWCYLVCCTLVATAAGDAALAIVRWLQ